MLYLVNIVMHNVYLHGDQVQWWLNESGLENYTTYTDWNTWAQQTNKVSIIELMAVDGPAIGADEQLVTAAVRESRLVIIIMYELFDDTICKQFDFDNVVFFLGGKLNYTLQNAKTAFCPYWFWSTVNFYKQFPEILSRLNDSKKSKYFDVLLGRKKNHRDYIFSNIDHSYNIVKYFPSSQDLDLTKYNSAEFVWPAEILDCPNTEINFTVQEVTVNGIIVSLSQIIPIDIYNQTHYTIVPETTNINGWSFFTEKVIKPMLARRLFLVEGGQYYLHNLRLLGFKTFDGVIDESYDLEPNMEKRMNMMLGQVAYLRTQDPVVIQQKIAPVVEHNFNHVMNFDWQIEMCKDIASCVNTL
jgi:hypothetical protein